MDVTACHTLPCAGHAIADRPAHEAWHAQIRAATQDYTEPAYGDVIAEWLDGLDADDLEKAAFASAGMDDNPTTALLGELRRRAGALA